MDRLGMIYERKGGKMGLEFCFGLREEGSAYEAVVRDAGEAP